MIHEFRNEKCFGLTMAGVRNLLLKDVAVHEKLILLYAKKEFIETVISIRFEIQRRLVFKERRVNLIFNFSEPNTISRIVSFLGITDTKLQ
jgi:hypothetical protein